MAWIEIFSPELCPQFLPPTVSAACSPALSARALGPDWLLPPYGERRTILYFSRVNKKFKNSNVRLWVAWARGVCVARTCVVVGALGSAHMR